MPCCRRSFWNCCAHGGCNADTASRAPAQAVLDARRIGLLRLTRGCATSWHNFGTTSDKEPKFAPEARPGDVVVPRPVVAPKAATPGSWTKDTRPAGANKGKPPGAAPQPQDETGPIQNPLLPW